MAKVLTRPKRITYKCSEEYYDKFHLKREELETTTGELLDKAVDLLYSNSTTNSSNSSYKMSEKIMSLVNENNTLKEKLSACEDLNERFVDLQCIE